MGNVIPTNVESDLEKTSPGLFQQFLETLESLFIAYSGKRGKKNRDRNKTKSGRNRNQGGTKQNRDKVKIKQGEVTEIQRQQGDTD